MLKTCFLPHTRIKCLLTIISFVLIQIKKYTTKNIYTTSRVQEGLRDLINIPLFNKHDKYTFLRVRLQIRIQNIILCHFIIKTLSHAVIN